MQFNGDVGASYDDVRVASAGFTYQGQAATGIGSLTMGHTCGATSPAGTFSVFEVLIPNYANTVGHKTTLTHGNMKQGAATGDFWIQTWSGWWRSTAAINRLRVLLSSSNFIAGSRATLYWIKAEPEGIRQNWNSSAMRLYYCALNTFAGQTWGKLKLSGALQSLIDPPTDFVLNADDSVTVVNSGWYDAAASVVVGDAASSTVYVTLSTSATPGDGDIANGQSTGTYARASCSGHVYLTAGQKVYVYGINSLATTTIRPDQFSIARAGAGPPGPPGGRVASTYAVTAGYTADRVVNPEATSLTGVARVLGTLIDDMKAAGLIAP